MRLRQSIATVSVLAASLASLTACGSSTGSSASDGSSSSSSSSSSSPSSGASSSGTAGSSGRLDKDTLIDAVTEAQRKAGSAHLTMTVSGSTALKAQGDVAYKGAQSEVQMTMTLAQLGSRQVQLRVVGGIIYVSIPQLTPAGKFIKIDPKDKSTALGKSFGNLSQQVDPLNSLASIKSSLSSVKYVGHASVAGTSTDHYRVVVDSAKLFKGLGQKAVPGVPATFTYDMFLDSKHLLRKMQFDLAGLKSVVLLSDWGKSVHVQVPAASQIVDPSKVAS